MENQTTQESSEKVFSKPIIETENNNEDLEEQELIENDEESDKYHSGL